MKRNSTLWLATGLLCFGLGVAGGKHFRSPPEQEAIAAPRQISPLGSAVDTRSAALLLDQIEHPEIIERLTTLERIANAGLDELPDLVRELMAAGSRDLIFKVIDRWIELDPAGGFEFFATQFPDEADDSYLVHLSVRWALVDPAAAIERAKKLEPGARTDYCLNSIVYELANQRPADYFKFYGTLADERSNHYLSEAAQQLSKTDPQAVLDFLPRLDAPVAYGVRGDIAFAWAEKDPAAATEWARGLDDDASRSRALHAIAAKLIETDPERAAAIYLEGGNADLPTKLSSRFIKPFRQPGGYIGASFGWNQIAKNLALKDPLAAFEWSRQFAEHSTLARAALDYLPPTASATIDYLAQLPPELFEPADTGAKISSSFNMGRPADVDEGLAKLDQIASPMLRETAHTWLLAEQAKTDPQTAIASAQSEILSENGRVQIVKNALRSWATTDPRAASAWLSEQSPGSDLDAGIGGMLGVMRTAEPDAAIRWASAISDPESRIEHLAEILSEQPIAWARETLQGLELSAEQRGQLSEPLDAIEAESAAPTP